MKLKRRLNLTLSLLSLVLIGLASFFLYEEWLTLKKETAASIDKELVETKYRVETRVEHLYEGLRAISLSPFVRQFDPLAEERPSEFKSSLSQLFQTAQESTRVSQIYLVTKFFDPDKVDRKTGFGELPLFRFDLMEVPQSSSNAEVKPENTNKIEKVTLDQFRVIREQMAFFRDKYPFKDQIKGSEVPAVLSREVVTEDNSELTKAEFRLGNDFSRRGLIYTVPVYDMAGHLTGGISGVLRSRVLQSDFRQTPMSLVCPEYQYQLMAVPSLELSNASGKFLKTRTVNELLGMRSVIVDFKDKASWKLIAVYPPKLFWSDPNIQARLSLRLLALLLIVLQFYFLLRIYLKKRA